LFYDGTTGCPQSPIVATGNSGAAFAAPNPNPGSGFCVRALSQVAIQAAGFGAAINIGFGQDWNALLNYPQKPTPVGIPYVASQNENSLPQIQQSGGCAFVVGGFLPSPNITVFLDFPSENLLLTDTYAYNGGVYNIQWIGLSCYLALLVISVYKIGVLSFVEGGFRLSVSQCSCQFAGFEQHRTQGWCKFLRVLAFFLFFFRLYSFGSLFQGDFTAYGSVFWRFLSPTCSVNRDYCFSLAYDNHLVFPCCFQGLH
jgi:hypothetical protein